MYQLNIMDVEESILLKATGYARSDSTGYRNATKKVIKELGYVGYFEREIHVDRVLHDLTVQSV